MKINSDDLATENISESLYENLEKPGIVKINRQLPPADIDPKDSYDIAIKVIRTPISSRTFVIGGTTNKSIRELTLDEEGKPIIIPLDTQYTVIIADEFQLFNKSTNLFR